MSGSRPYITFGAPQIGDSEVAEVSDCVRSGWLGTGPRVAQFEAEFAEYKGVPPEHVLAVNSCTAALHISMIAARLEPGSEVITTPLTFCATVNAIIHAGLKPVLADINPETQNIDPDAVLAAITPRTSAILPVHFAGRPCDMERILRIADRHGLVVIEDCAHAIEAGIDGHKTGTFGQFGCFSFYVTKNLATGEGGMIIGRDAAEIARAKVLALHGMSKDAWHRFSDEGFKHYQVVDCGFKYNMMDLQAAIGIHQLRRLESNLARRNVLWTRYQKAFEDLPVGRPADELRGHRHARHLYTLQINPEALPLDRDQFMLRLHRQGIGTGVHYRSIPDHPYYRERFGWRAEDWPHAHAIGGQTVSLPLSAKLSDGDQGRVIEVVRDALTAKY